MRKRSKRSITPPPDEDDGTRAASLRMSIARLGLPRADVRRLRALGIRTLGDLARERSLDALARELDERSITAIRGALRGARAGADGRRSDRRGPGELPADVRESLARAKRASTRWKGARLARDRAPIREEDRIRQSPRLKAMLAMADATVKALRNHQPWVTAERVKAELDAYSRAVDELLGPEE
jgi:nucleotidyltransferase/DNA polymerase involved in DNA repair